MIQHLVEQGTKAWFDIRLGKPTASRAHKLITPKTRKVSAQAKDLRDILLAERISGEPYELYQSPWMQEGQEREDQSVRAYESLAEIETEPGGYWSDDADTYGASPDRLVGEHGLLELKNPLLHTQVRVALEGDGADDHLVQLQTQLLVTERKWCDVFHFHPQLVLPPRRVYRDEEFIRQIKAVLEIFVEELETAWKRLQSEHGPFVRLAPEPPPVPVDDPLGVSPAEVDEIFAARRRAQQL